MTLRFNWGTGVALVYAAFAAGTMSMVALASTSRVDLVSEDYYARSLTVDQRIAAVDNGTRAITALDVITSDGQAQLVLHLARPIPADAHGTLTWYRPSSAAADRTMPLGRTTLMNPVPLTGLTSGRWRAQLQWTAAGQDFYVEREVELP
jgi:hypothetical protein